MMMRSHLVRLTSSFFLLLKVLRLRRMLENGCPSVDLFLVCCDAVGDHFVLSFASARSLSLRWSRSAYTTQHE